MINYPHVQHTYPAPTVCADLHQCIRVTQFFIGNRRNEPYQWRDEVILNHFVGSILNDRHHYKYEKIKKRKEDCKFEI